MYIFHYADNYILKQMTRWQGFIFFPLKSLNQVHFPLPSACSGEMAALALEKT